MRLSLLPDVLAVCRLPATAPLPGWFPSKGFVSATRTADELSIVCAASAVPSGTRCEAPWRALVVEGPLDFGLTGILASIADPLAAAGIPIFVISTFDTDYVLVKAERVGAAVEALAAAGHEVRGEG